MFWIETLKCIRILQQEEVGLFTEFNSNILIFIRLAVIFCQMLRNRVYKFIRRVQLSVIFMLWTCIIVSWMNIYKDYQNFIKLWHKLLICFFIFVTIRNKEVAFCFKILNSWVSVLWRIWLHNWPCRKCIHGLASVIMKFWFS